METKTCILLLDSLSCFFTAKDCYTIPVHAYVKSRPWSDTRELECRSAGAELSRNAKLEILQLGQELSGALDQRREAGPALLADDCQRVFFVCERAVMNTGELQPPGDLEYAGRPLPQHVSPGARHASEIRWGPGLKTKHWFHTLPFPNSSTQKYNCF